MRPKAQEPRLPTTYCPNTQVPLCYGFKGTPRPFLGPPKNSAHPNTLRPFETQFSAFDSWGIESTGSRKYFCSPGGSLSHQNKGGMDSESRFSCTKQLEIPLFPFLSRPKHPKGNHLLGPKHPNYPQKVGLHPRVLGQQTYLFVRDQVYSFGKPGGNLRLMGYMPTYGCTPVHGFRCLGFS